MKNTFLYGYIKLYIRVKTLTGLRIGGRKETVEIGDVDLSVIKDPITELPYIPGSSLKGKLRSLVEKINNMFGYYEKENVQNQQEIDDFINKIKNKQEKPKNPEEPFGINIKIKKPTNPEETSDINIKTKDYENYILTKLVKEFPIIRMFGNHKSDIGIEPRLIIRDLICMNKNKDEIYEIKPENIVDRVRGRAQHPREIERVRKGVEFTGEIVYRLYGWDILSEEEVIQQTLEDMNKLKQAIIYLMKYDYLGGSGTRGYGKVALWIDKIEIEFDNNKKIIEAKDFEKINGDDKLTNELKKIGKEILDVAIEESKKYSENIIL